MTITYFEDLKTWQESRVLTRHIYQLTKKSEFRKDYGLVDQIRRASVSIMSNIAEGFEREGNQEFSQFLSIAKASCGEVRSQLYIAFDQAYLSQEEFHEALEKTKKISIMLKHFMTHLKRSQYKGAKFKKEKTLTMKEEIDVFLKTFQKKS